jgi:hypothetical protein
MVLAVAQKAMDRALRILPLYGSADQPVIARAFVRRAIVEEHAISDPEPARA